MHIFNIGGRVFIMAVSVTNCGNRSNMCCVIDLLIGDDCVRSYYI